MAHGFKYTKLYIIRCQISYNLHLLIEVSRAVSWLVELINWSASRSGEDAIWSGRYTVRLRTILLGFVLFLNCDTLVDLLFMFFKSGSVPLSGNPCMPPCQLSNPRWMGKLTCTKLQQKRGVVVCLFLTNMTLGPLTKSQLKQIIWFRVVSKVLEAILTSFI